MKKILVSINNNSLIFSYSMQNDDATKSLMNTNVISNNELIFSDEYILSNSKILGLFLKELMDDKKITKLIIAKFDIVNLLQEALTKINTMDTLYIVDESNFTYEAYESIIKLNKFKNISCYSIPTYMIELFDHHNIQVESRAEILFTSNFMEENNLIAYSKIYYKMAVRLSPPLTADDLKDFATFCKINKYLKTVHFNACNLESLDSIAQILINNRLKNIKIIIHDNITNKEIVENLKSRKKTYAKNHLNLELKYTEEYVNKNYLKQIIVTTLLTCSLIALLIFGGASIYVVLNNQESENNIASINEQIENKINEDTNDNIQSTDDNPTTDNEESTDTTPTMLPKMASLLDLNSETVGWLTVPGTNIDYPVVQTTDNKYYLNHNYNKEKDYNGWVFMNYYNVPQNLDKNTIIFAHNRYYSGVMFGTLSNLTKKNWYSEANNISIYYNTLYDEYEWEVFSIYKINVTDDYLKTIFKTDAEWLDFIELIRSRSIFESSAIVGVNDKIITLSTCLDNDQRLVVHAVLKQKS